MKSKLLILVMLLGVVVYFSSCFVAAPGYGYGYNSYPYHHGYWYHGWHSHPHDVHGRDWHRQYYR